MRGIVFVNRLSGPDCQDPDELRDWLPDADVETVEPDDLAARVTRARDDRRPFVGVVGGDGTVRTAAAGLVGSGVPLLVIPGGTRNHFARELGNETVEVAAGSRTARVVSVGCVNGEMFVNNASVGLYPALVRRRHRQMHAAGRSKRAANLIAAWELLRRAKPVTVELDGEACPVWLLFVGNGRYGDGFSDLVERDALDGEVLDIRMLRADVRGARWRVAGAVLAGRLRSSKLIVAREAKQMCVRLPGRGSVDVAIDGEVVRLEPPLEFSVAVRALTVLVPDTTGYGEEPSPVPAAG